MCLAVSMPSVSVVDSNSETQEVLPGELDASSPFLSDGFVFAGGE